MGTALKVAKKMKKFNIDRRHEPVIAIGGGVCLDVVGMAASLFRRRTPYIRVPTTSLSYVDASVGAKKWMQLLRFQEPSWNICAPHCSTAGQQLLPDAGI